LQFNLLGDNAETTLRFDTASAQPVPDAFKLPSCNFMKFHGVRVVEKR